jgi:hypothetical protein
MTRKDAERQEAAEKLRAFISPGDTIYTTLRKVSRSGMSRIIDLHVIKDGEPRWIGYTAATALGMTWKDREQGVKVGGCGMDMGFHLVYELSYALFKGGFGCIGQGCPANDHSNGDRDYTPDEKHATGPAHVCATNPETCTAKRHLHSDAGYALKQRWL